MKNFKIILLLSMLSIPSLAKLPALPEIPVILISKKSALHFRSPEPVSYVDLPRGKLSGDLPLKNLVRLRLDTSFFTNMNREELGILTITGEHFLAQYRLVYISSETSMLQSEVEILPSHMSPLVPSSPSLSTPQMHSKSLEMLSVKPPKSCIKAENEGISIELNQILTCADLLFLDLSFKNSSKLMYHPEQLSFSIADKKVAKSTNFQSFSLQPVFTLNPLEVFFKQSRQIIVLPKATFSASKTLHISLSEKQPSSRLVVLKLSYRDILSADRF